MAADAVEIGNMALSLVGALPVTAFTDETNEARWLNTNYVTIKRAVLTERAWSFAEEQLVLTGPSAGNWGNAYLYAIPADVLRIYRVYEDVSGRPRQAKWRRLGKDILADVNGTMYALAIMGNIAEADMPDVFVQALATRLAAEMAIPLTRSRQLQADMATLYQAKLAIAAAADGSESRTERTDSTELVNVRAGGGYSA